VTPPLDPPGFPERSRTIPRHWRSLSVRPGSHRPQLVGSPPGFAGDLVPYEKSRACDREARLPVPHARAGSACDRDPFASSVGGLFRFLHRAVPFCQRDRDEYTGVGATRCELIHTTSPRPRGCGSVRSGFSAKFLRHCAAPALACWRSSQILERYQLSAGHRPHRFARARLLTGNGGDQPSRLLRCRSRKMRETKRVEGITSR
jgi:hypothetical protein